MSSIFEERASQRNEKTVSSGNVFEQRSATRVKQPDSSSYDKFKGFLSELPKAGMKMIAIPAARASEVLGGLPGSAIEMPSDLTKTMYEMFGQEPPEWTSGPSPLRLSESGEVNIQTPQELRESTTPKLFGSIAEPSNPVEEILSQGSEIASNLATGGVRNPKALIAGTTAALGTRKAAEKFGIHPTAAMVAETAATGLASAKSKKPAQPTGPKSKELAETAVKEGIRAPAAILEADRPFVSKFLRSWGKPGELVKDRAKQFVSDVENAYHKVIGEIYSPYKIERNISVLNKQMKNLFEPVERMAKNYTGQVPSTQIIQVIDDQINKLKSTRSLATSEAEALKILQKTRKDIVNRGMNLENAVDTFRSYNKHIDWDQPTKNDLHLRNVKEALRDEIQNTGRRVPGFTEQFNLSNEARTQLAHLAEASDIMKHSFDKAGRFDINKFSDIAKNPNNSTKLKELLGIQGYNRLYKISNLAEEGAKNFEAVNAMIPKELQGIGSAVTASIGLVTGAPYSVTGELLFRNMAARMLTNPNLQKNYIGYLQALKRNSPKVAAYHLRQMQGDIQAAKSEKSDEEMK